MSGSTNIPPSMDGTTTASSDPNTVTGPSVQIEANRLPQSPLVAATTNVVTQFSPVMSSPEASKDDPSTGQDETQQKPSEVVVPNKNNTEAVQQGDDTKTSTAVDPEKDAHESAVDNRHQRMKRMMQRHQWTPRMESKLNLAC